MQWHRAPRQIERKRGRAAAWHAFRKRLLFCGAPIRLFAILWSVLLLTPWTPPAFDIGSYDEAYTIFAHIAFAQGRPWGTAGALHTGGPLGFLRFPVFYQPTYAAFIIGNACVGAAAGLVIDEIARVHLKKWARIPFVAAMVWILSVSDEAVWGFLLLVPQILIPAFSRSERWTVRSDSRWLRWPLVINLAACAVAINAKGSFLLMGALVGAEILLWELFARRLPLVSAAFAGIIALIARLSGFRISDWGPYTKHILGSVIGYAETFSILDPMWDAALLSFSAMWLIAIAACSARHSHGRLQAAVRWSLFAMLLWMNVKAALIRPDTIHQVRAITLLTVFFAVYAAAYWNQWSRRTKISSFLPALCLAALFVRAVRDLELMPNLAEFASLLQQGVAPAEAEDAMMRTKVAEQIKSPWSSTSSVAVFGTYQSLLLGHPGRLLNLPVIASYEIWSPWTSRLERDFFLNSNPPDYLVYTASPSSAEVACTLTSVYEEVERGQQYRLLRRRPVPLTVTRRAVLEENIDAGDVVELEPEWRTGPAIVEVRYTKTFLHSVLSALYQPAEAYLVLFEGRKPFAKIRMNPLLSAEGIVLAGAPGIWNGRGLRLGSIRFGLLTGERVQATAFGFEANGALGKNWNRYFGRSLRVRIYIPDFEDRTSPGSQRDSGERPSLR